MEKRRVAFLKINKLMSAIRLFLVSVTEVAAKTVFNRIDLV